MTASSINLTSCAREKKKPIWMLLESNQGRLGSKQPRDPLLLSSQALRLLKLDRFGTVVIVLASRPVAPGLIISIPKYQGCPDLSIAHWYLLERRQCKD